MRHLTKKEERKLRPDASFRYLFSSGQGVLMVAEIPTRTRGVQVAIPEDLQHALIEATLGIRWTSAMVALADYAARHASKREVAQEPDAGAASSTLRYRLPIPLDVRRHVERVQVGPFTKTLVALARIALADLKSSKRRLVVLPP